MKPELRGAARDAIGFMPEEEGLALYESALKVAPEGPFLEIGSYCGKSAIYIGAAAAERQTVLFSVDHHRGSEEHQPGEGFHDPRLTGPDGKVDTLPEFRRTISGAGLDDVVIGILGRSGEMARYWSTPLAFLFIDGGHSQEAADADLDGWSPHLGPGGILAIHDVFPDPRDGGRPPFNIYRRALDSGGFTEMGGAGSLRLLIRDGAAD